MTQNEAKLLLRIINALQKQLENNQQQIKTLTEELVKISATVDKLGKSD